jgi:hypothetical protein
MIMDILCLVLCVSVRLGFFLFTGHLVEFVCVISSLFSCVFYLRKIAVSMHFR